jgi:macrolide-specific efflux system membrane fusion protein
VRQILPIQPKPLEQISQGSGSPANPAGGGRVVLYTVLLDVDNADNALMADMTTQVFFVNGSARDVLTVPIAALQDDDGDPGTQQARVLAGNGQVQVRKVRTGLSDRLRIEVLDGLREGERLLVGPASGSEG